MVGKLKKDECDRIMKVAVVGYSAGEISPQGYRGKP